LRERGQRTARKRVARLMRAAGLCARGRRRFRSATNAAHGMAIKGNLLSRRFAVPAPNSGWVTDLTYLWTLEGWLYLAVVLDLYSRRVVGWALSERLECGSQYASHEYEQLVVEHVVLSSMSRKGNCWDNAVAESFFASFKVELVYQSHLRIRTQARSEVFEHIELF
jgi:transposase InsO family protein